MIGTLIGLYGFQIAHMAHDGELVGDAVGAHQVTAQTRAIEGNSNVIFLQHGNMSSINFARIFQPRTLQRQQLRFGDFGNHPCQLFLHQLVAGNGPVVKLFAHNGIGSSRFIAIHGCAHHTPANPVTRLRKAGQRPLQALRPRQHGRIRHTAVVERQTRRNRRPHGLLTVNIRRFEARRTALYEETANALRGARPHYRNIGNSAISYPGFLAVDDPVRTIFHGAREHTRGVGAEIGLGQTKAADGLAFLHIGQPAVLLSIRAIGVNRIHHQRALHGNETAQAGIAALNLLHDQAVLHAVHAGAAVAIEIGPEEAQFSNLRNQFRRQTPFAKPIAGKGNHAFVHEPPGGLPDHEFLLCEQGIDIEVVNAAKCHIELSV